MKAFLLNYKGTIIFWIVFLAIVLYFAPRQHDHYLDDDIKNFINAHLIPVLIWTGVVTSIIILFFVLVKTRSIKQSVVSRLFFRLTEVKLNIMASAFWTLEDGRGFARSWSAMAYMLELITNELKEIKGAEEFYEYLEKFVFREENGDTYNGYGGFIRGDVNVMFNIDLRTFAPKNREYFWLATQKALTTLKILDDNKNEGMDLLMTTLLDMHKRIKKGEDPMLLNHMRIIEPDPNEKLGPGW